MWGEGVVLLSWGVGKWEVSGNEGLTEEGVLMVFVCLVHSTSEKLGAQLSIQGSKLKFILV